MKKKTLSSIGVSILMVFAVFVISGCGQNSVKNANAETTAGTHITVYKVEAAPKMDGNPGEALWKDIESTKVKVSDGREALIKAAYRGDEIFMSVVWPGIPESGALRQWEFDGTKWTKEYG